MRPTDDARKIYIPIARELVASCNGKWSERPVYVKFEVRADGTADLWMRHDPPRAQGGDLS